MGITAVLSGVRGVFGVAWPEVRGEMAGRGKEEEAERPWVAVRKDWVGDS